MSQRLGQPAELLSNANPGALNTGKAVSAVTNPTGNGVTLTTNPATIQWVVLDSIYFQYVASATVGTRTILLVIKDAIGNILWETPIATGLVASATLNGMFAGGVQVANAVGPPIQTFGPLPFEFPLPPGATITVEDTASINTGDTVLINAITVF